MAAVLACGPEGALSDQTAGSIWGMLLSRRPQAPVDRTGPRTLRGPASGVRLHRRGVLAADEVTRRHGLPLTTPSRTVFDLASSLGSHELERILALAPTDTDIIGDATTLAQGLGRLEEAIQMKEYLVARDPVSPQGFHNLSNAYRWAGRWDEAIDSYHTAESLSPGSIGAHTGVAHPLMAAHRASMQFRPVGVYIVGESTSPAPFFPG